jgi:hypothetical protein
VTDRQLDELEALSTEELRRQAFSKAEHAHDARFFWDIATHLRSARAIAGEDGSAGAITGSIAEGITLVREMLGRAPLGEDEPLVRARLIEYLRQP